jgi:hypothetical protein
MKTKGTLMTQQSLTQLINGKKSYLCVAAYVVYWIGIKNMWWHQNASFEVTLVAGFGASMRHAIQKLNDDVNAAPDVPVIVTATSVAPNPAIASLPQQPLIPQQPVANAPLNPQPTSTLTGLGNK